MKLSPDRQQFGCVVLVLSEDNKKVLLGKRKNAYKAGLYGLPGGCVEFGEKLAETAHRELKEETTLSAINMEYIGVFKEAQEEFDFVHFVFTCREYTGELTTAEPEKCEGWEWFELSYLPQNILKGHAAAIEFLHGAGKSTLKDI